MKNTLIVFVIICLTIFQWNFAKAEVKKDAGYLSLSSSKVKELEPNNAQVSFAVETIANDAQKAVNDNNQVSNNIINALKLVTAADTDTIKTNNFSVRPNYVYGKDGVRSIKNYIAVNSITVNTKDINKVSKLIDTAISNGANRTDNLFYSYENPSQVCQSLYPEIMKELREQANAIAAASGASVDGIKFLNVSCNSDMSVSNGRFFAAKAGGNLDSAVNDSSTPVESGKVTVRVNINADYYLK